MAKRRINLSDAEKDRLAALIWNPDHNPKRRPFTDLPERARTHLRYLAVRVAQEAVAMTAPAKKPEPRMDPIAHQVAVGHAEQESRQDPRGGSGTIYANAKESQLSWYRARRLITDAEFTAGSRLYSYFYHSGRESSAAALDADKVDGGGNKGPTDRQMEAAADYELALRAVGTHLSPILVAVCVLSEGAGDWARAHGHHERAGIVVLRIALRTLADHFAQADRGGAIAGARKVDYVDMGLLRKFAGSESTS